MSFEDDRPTLLQCQACGGKDDLRRLCNWCLGLGMIDERQLTLWKEWRSMQRKTSATHSVLQGICEAVLKRLRESEIAGAQAMRVEGERLLDHWLTAEDMERAQAAADLLAWHRLSLELLTRG